MEKKALGRGLEALLPEKDLGMAVGTLVEEIELDRIIPNRYQPRQAFDDNGIRELAASVKAQGVVEPVLVRRVDGERFELIAGERRWRAAGLAGRTRIPAIVREATPSESLQLALTENLMRKDLNPLEAARAYQQLMRDFDLTQDQIAQGVGKDRSSISNCLRLLNLPESIQADLLADRLTLGHAKALLSLTRFSDQISVGRLIVRKGLSVREAEALVRRMGKDAKGRRAAGHQKAEMMKVQEQLCYRLGTKVKLAGQPSRGQILIDYYTAEDLDRILDLILGQK